MKQKKNVRNSVVDAVAEVIEQMSESDFVLWREHNMQVQQIYDIGDRMIVQVSSIYSFDADE